MGYLDASLRPDGRIAAALARSARRPQAWSLPPPEGIPELRAWFASEIGVEREDVIVSSGIQGAISATMRALLPAGSPVLFVVPTYPGALAAARSAGLVPVPVPCDGMGVIPALLERAFARTNARLAYLQPTFANPDGQCLSANRRAEILRIANRAGAFLLEDDWARWLSHGPLAPPPLIRDDAHGHVITLTSLTKVGAPSLRVGAIAARGPVLRRIASMRLVDEFFVSRPLQDASVEFVTSAGWRSHLRLLSEELRERASTLAAAVVKHIPACSFDLPKGGNSLWVRLPAGMDDKVIAEEALAQGVAVSPGSAYTISEQQDRNLRLSFVSISTSSIDEAVRRLSLAVSNNQRVL
jgi:DNA-binding transcriptional MocR family regulator